MGILEKTHSVKNKQIYPPDIHVNITRWPLRDKKNATNIPQSDVREEISHVLGDQIWSFWREKGTKNSKNGHFRAL